LAPDQKPSEQDAAAQSPDQDGSADATPENGYELRATRDLSRARKMLSANNWEPDAMSEFLVRSANTYALLALASAISESTDD
jgi:hypothetical protein